MRRRECGVRPRGSSGRSLPPRATLASWTSGWRRRCRTLLALRGRPVQVANTNSSGAGWPCWNSLSTSRRMGRRLIVLTPAGVFDSTWMVPLPRSTSAHLRPRASPSRSPEKIRVASRARALPRPSRASRSRPAAASSRAPIWSVRSTKERSGAGLKTRRRRPRAGLRESLRIPRLARGSTLASRSFC